MGLTSLPDVGIAISIEHCPKCNGSLAFVRTREQAKAMTRAGVFNTLKEKQPGLLALWGGSGLRACPKCRRLLPLPTPKQWADSPHSEFDFGLGTETKTLIDSERFALCSACGASCTGEPGTFGRVRSVGITIPIATGQKDAVCIRETPGSQPVVYADVHPDHVELDFPVCSPGCSEAMQAELDKADIDDTLALVRQALIDREAWEKMTWP